MLGERLIVLNDYHAICATIATIIAIQHGVDIKDIVSKFSKDIADTVSTALVAVSASAIVAKNDDGIIKL